MAELNVEEPLSSVSENSFVILCEGSVPPDINCESINSDIASIFSKHETNTNVEGIQSKFYESSNFNENHNQTKLNQLIRENYHLRKTLIQNNLAIKSQLDTFFIWQQEVLKTHETHKKKFLETREMILKLKAENADLKKQLQENSQCCSIVDKNIQLSNLEDEIKIKNNPTDENLKLENLDLKEKLRNAESIILKLNKSLEDVTRENKFLKQKNLENQNNSSLNVSHVSLPNSDARVQISNLIKQLDDEKTKVINLKEELNKLKNIDCVTSEAKLIPIEELESGFKKLDNSNSFDLKNQRPNSIFSWDLLPEENLQTLSKYKLIEHSGNHEMSEIEKRATHLHLKVKFSTENQDTLLKIQSKFQELLENYNKLNENIDLSDNSSSNFQQLKDEIKSLTEEIKVKENDLLFKQHECDELKEQIKKLNLECEEIAALRIQVQLYQSDFKMERTAREILASEKEDMERQILSMQVTLEELQKILPSSRREYACPKCMYSFSDVEKYEKHIEECLFLEY